MDFVHLYGETHTVGPEYLNYGLVRYRTGQNVETYPIPPHCPHCGTVPDAGGAVVAGGGVVTTVVVAGGGLFVVTGGGLEPLHMKTEGPGIV